MTKIKWDDEALEKGGYERFMMKEIHEQLNRTLTVVNVVGSSIARETDDVFYTLASLRLQLR